MGDSRFIQCLHAASDVRAPRSFPRPAHHHGEPALTDPSQLKNVDQQPGAIHQMERRAISMGWLCQVLTCPPGCVTVGGPQKSALGTVFCAWLHFQFC